MAKFMENKKRAWTIISIIIASAVLLLTLIGGGVYLFLFRTLPEGLTIAGIDVGGMKYTEASNALDAAQTKLKETPLLITVDDETLILDQEDIGIKLKKGSVLFAALWENHAENVDTSAYYSYNRDALNTMLQEYAAQFESQLTETEYRVDGERPDLTGATVTGDNQTLIIIKGKPEASLDTQMLTESIVGCYDKGLFTLDFPLTSNPPSEPDWEALSEELCAKPIDAVMDKETFEVSNHTYGYAFDIETAKEAYAAAEYGEELTIPFAPVKPAALQDELKAMLFRDVLGSYTAYSSSQYNRDVNLRLSCNAINGKILYPGQSISYNATLGQRTPEKGYKPAASYYGSETITSYGGGICQASSSLYYAALIADLEIVERHNHGYVSSYMPLGMDATVDWSGPDLKIRNNTEYPIRIEAYASGGTVTVKLIGTDTKDYYVKMTYEVLSVTNYKTIEVEMEKNNSKGYKDGEVITSPYTGYKVRTYKLKYDKATNELISSKAEATSTYSKRDKEVCKIKTTTVPTPTAPPTTTPPTTTPPTTVAPETTQATEPSPGIGGIVGEDG